MMKDKEWLKDKILKMSYIPLGLDKSNSVISTNWVTNYIDQLDEPEITEEQVDKYLDEQDLVAVDAMMHAELMQGKPERPAIPSFVANWIDEHALQGSNPLKVYRELAGDFSEGWTDVADAEVYHWISKNPYLFIDALRLGFEVEKEKLYRVRAGKSYVRFNLDGSIIGAKAVNSVVTLDRLSKLPFDYKKAVESGIITLVEVTE